MHIRKLDDCYVTFLVLLRFGIEYFADFFSLSQPGNGGVAATARLGAYLNSLPPTFLLNSSRESLSRGETLPNGGEGKREDRPVLSRDRAVSRLDGSAMSLDYLLADEQTEPGAAR